LPAGPRLPARAVSGRAVCTPIILGRRGDPLGWGGGKRPQDPTWPRAGPPPFPRGVPFLARILDGWPPRRGSIVQDLSPVFWLAPPPPPGARAVPGGGDVGGPAAHVRKCWNCAARGGCHGLAGTAAHTISAGPCPSFPTPTAPVFPAPGRPPLSATWAKYSSACAGRPITNTVALSLLVWPEPVNKLIFLSTGRKQFSALARTVTRFSRNTAPSPLNNKQQKKKVFFFVLFFPPWGAPEKTQKTQKKPRPNPAWSLAWRSIGLVKPAPPLGPVACHPDPSLSARVFVPRRRRAESLTCSKRKARNEQP